jgi:Tol biopolymer transport system component
MKRKALLLLSLGLFFLVQAGGICWPQTTERVSVGPGGIEGNNASNAPSISGNGRYVAFESLSTNLVAGDGNGVIDIFVHDRNTATTTRVSVDSLGNEGNGDSNFPSISSDGRYVAFESDADNLIGVGNDTNGSTDIFVHDLQTGETTRVSVDSTGTQGDNHSYSPSISSDGKFVAFQSDADNLIGVGNDTNGTTDVFVDDRPGGNEETSGSSSSSNSGCFMATAASYGGS